MFEVVSQTPKEIIVTYIVILTACCITYPLIRLIIKAAEKGLGKWR